MTSLKCEGKGNPCGKGKKGQNELKGTLMDLQHLIYEKESLIGKITVNRPQVLNAFNSQTIVELKHLLSQIENDSQVRVVIITGAGEKAFVVGADREELKRQQESEEDARTFETCCRETFTFLENLGKPSIGSINGYAFGLGLQLTLACTLRIISENAKLGLPEINLGFFPSMGATQRLTRLIGEAKTSEMILTGEPIDAEEAYRIGLVNKKVPPSELTSITQILARKLAEKSPMAVKLALEAIKHGRRAAGESGFVFEGMLSELCLRTEGAKEGLLANQEKRKPNFKGM
jgi:enoyl-CoA hydratase